jgi:hypothetical protein
VIQIHLNWEDRRWATEIGKARWNSPRRIGVKEEDRVDEAGAELALARVVGVEWPALINDPGLVFPDWRVRLLRQTKGFHAGVRVSSDDDDDAQVVWIAGGMPTFQLMGYIRAGGAKRHTEWIITPKTKRDPYIRVPTNRMIEINPGFHSLCAYKVDSWGEWSCAHCGAISGAA